MKLLQMDYPYSARGATAWRTATAFMHHGLLKPNMCYNRSDL